MRSLISGLLMVGVAYTGAAGAGGYDAPRYGAGSVNWPPPGGLDSVQPSLPVQSKPRLDGFRPYAGYRTAPRYLPSYRRRGEFIAPPGPNWPDADYGKSKDAPAAEAEAEPVPVEPGIPVEVIPPPSIPIEEIEEIEATISDKPQRGWRPTGSDSDRASTEKPPEGGSP